MEILIISSKRNKEPVREDQSMAHLEKKTPLNVLLQQNAPSNVPKKRIYVTQISFPP